MTTSPAGALVFNVAGLLGDPPGAHRDIKVAGVTMDLGEDVRQAAPLSVAVRLARTNRGVFVTGGVAVVLADTCGRCLVPIEVPLDVAIEEEVLPSVDLRSGLPIETADEPEAVRLSDHHELDLEVLAREAVQLAAPIAPVCDLDCAGLCPVCGGDLNTAPHGHPDGPPDPRLARLADFVADDRDDPSAAPGRR
jgi:uncharacterized protein